MPLWKRDVKSKLRELIKEEEYREIDSLVDKDINVLVQLVDLLEDKDSQVRGKAVAALAEAVLMHEDTYFRELEDIVVLQVLKLLRDSNPEVRREAALAVSSFPSRAYCGISKEGPELIEQATPQLIRLLEDEDSRVQRSAGTSLFAVAHWLLENEKEVKAALDILSRLAEHRDIRNRIDAAYFWIKHAKEFPEAAKRMVSVLEKLTKDPDEEVRQYAESVLKTLVT
jgi:HEAT repeat protein